MENNNVLQPLNLSLERELIASIFEAENKKNLSLLDYYLLKYKCKFRKSIDFENINPYKKYLVRRIDKLIYKRLK